MTQAQVNAFAELRSERAMAVRNLLLTEGIEQPTRLASQTSKKRKRPAGVTSPRSPRTPATKMKRTTKTPSPAAEHSTIFTTVPSSQTPVQNDFFINSISANPTPDSSCLPITIPTEHLNTLSQMLDFVVPDIISASEFPQQPQVNTSLETPSFPSNNTFIADVSSILMLFSNIFDVYVAPHILASSLVDSDPTSDLRIFLYRQFLLNEFHQSIRKALASRSSSSASSTSINSTSVSSNILSLDNLLQIFLESSRKLGITTQTSVSS